MPDMEPVLNAEDTELSKVAANGEDYVGNDGLLICGKCGKPKQMRLEYPLGGSPHIVGIACECERRAMEEREVHEAEQRRIEAARKARNECFRTASAYRNCTFERDDGANPRVSMICQRFADTFAKGDPNGLLMFGGVGVGKSFLASAIANRLIDRGFKAISTDIGTITTLLEESFSDRNKTLTRLFTYDLVIVEDLGAQRWSDYMMGNVYAVIDGCYRNGTPMVITTNLTSEKIQSLRSNDPAWGRILDRIVERCYPVRFGGTSRRRDNSKKMREDMEKRLGL